MHKYDGYNRIGVAITQGNLCPRFCRYDSDFRTQNYKSRASQEKQLQKNVPVRKNAPTKAWGFYSLGFVFISIFEIALNSHNTFVGPCSNVGW